MTTQRPKCPEGTYYGGPAVGCLPIPGYRPRVKRTGLPGPMRAPQPFTLKRPTRAPVKLRIATLRSE
jgi:hypothetical protein